MWRDQNSGTSKGTKELSLVAMGIHYNLVEHGPWIHLQVMDGGTCRTGQTYRSLSSNNTAQNQHIILVYKSALTILSDQDQVYSILPIFYKWQINRSKQQYLAYRLTHSLWVLHSSIAYISRNLPNITFQWISQTKPWSMLRSSK